MKKVFATGATGYQGRHLVKHLHELGYWVRALARPGKSVEFADEVFHGSATYPITLHGLCDNIQWVFSSLGNTRQTDKVTDMDVDYGANANVLHRHCRAGWNGSGLCQW